MKKGPDYPSPEHTSLPVAAHPQGVSPPGGAPLPESLRRSPTLMAGEVAGAQGRVEVWAPERSRIRRQAIVSVGVLAAASTSLAVLQSALLLAWLVGHLPFWGIVTLMLLVATVVGFSLGICLELAAGPPGGVAAVLRDDGRRRDWDYDLERQPCAAVG